MATKAQIAANRRNALKSTGPKTSIGMSRSSLNSRKHGDYSVIEWEEMSPIVDMIEEELLRVGVDARDPTIASKVARLARSEVFLKRVQKTELERSAAVDDGHTYETDADAIDEKTLVEVLKTLNIDGNHIPMALSVLREATFGGGGTIRKRYKRRRRSLSDAEAAHSKALKALIK
jgi:hypothetical protein